MAKIISKDNQENVYLFILLFVLSVVTLRKIKRSENKRKEVTAVLMEHYDSNIL